MKQDSSRLLASSLRRMVRAEHRTQMRRLVAKSHPADIAFVMPSLTPSQRRVVFEQIEDAERAASVLSELEPAILGEMVDKLTDERLSELVTYMPSDDAVDVLQWVDDERQQKLFEFLSLDEVSEAESLISHDPESAGGLMSTEVFALDDETTASDAIARLQSSQSEVVFYLYVINEHEHLVGVLSLRELVQAAPESTLRELMITDVIRVSVEQDQEEVARLVARYNLLALPVVDTTNRLVGVVTVDDIIDVIRLEATEDIMKMAGAGEDVSPHDSPIVGFRARLPWLLPSFVAGILGVLVVSAYEAAIIAVLPLAALIPMLMGMAGNIGTQSSAIVTRWIALGRVEFMQLGRIIVRELAIGMGVGLLYGALAASFVAWFFSGHSAVSGSYVEFSLVTGGSVAAAMTLAATLGAAAPLVFEKSGFDPAIATGPFVTTTIDVLAVWLYLAVAAMLLVS